MEDKTYTRAEMDIIMEKHIEKNCKILAQDLKSEHKDQLYV